MVIAGELAEREVYLALVIICISLKERVDLLQDQDQAGPCNQEKK